MALISLARSEDSACRGTVNTRAQEAGTYLSLCLETVRARLELTDQGSALKTAYHGTTHVVFERGGLPPSDFMVKLAELDLHGRLSDIRHHKRVIFNYDTYLTLCVWEKSSIYSHKNGRFIWLKI